MLLVAYHYPPLAVIGTARAVRFVHAMRRAGWEVAVLAATEDSEPSTPIDPAAYPTRDDVLVHRARGFEVVAQLSRRLRRGHAECGTRTAKKAAIGQDGGAARRNFIGSWFREGLSQLLQVPDLYVGWLARARPLGRRLVRDYRPDVVLATSPPQSALILARLLARAARCPLVVDLRDPWIDNPYRGQTWFAPARWLDARLERWVLGAARGVIANTPALARRLAGRYPGLRSRIVAIANGVDLGLSLPPPAQRACAASCLHVMHLGSLYAERSPEPVVQAVELLLRAGRVAAGQLCIEFLGAFSVPGLEPEILTQRTAGIVRFSGRVAREEAVARAQAADVLLVLQPGAPLQVPGKIFEYMALGKELLTVADEGATAELARGAQLGPICAPDAPQAIAEALVQLLERKRCGALRPPARDVLRDYDAEVQCERLLALVAGIARNRREVRSS